jgi:hypothetical protein
MWGFSVQQQLPPRSLALTFLADSFMTWLGSQSLTRTDTQPTG